jgi:capsular polysaccharide biosynthesis protein
VQRWLATSENASYETVWKFRMGHQSVLRKRPRWAEGVPIGRLAGVAVVATRLQPPEYDASALLRVDEYASPTGTDVQRVATTIGSRAVAEETIRRLGLLMDPAELLDNLTARRAYTSRIVRLTYADTEPYRAMQIANALAEVASERVSNNGVATSVYKKASLPYTPVSSKAFRNGLAALAAGLVLGAGFAFLLEPSRGEDLRPAVDARRRRR